MHATDQKARYHENVYNSGFIVYVKNLNLKIVTVLQIIKPTRFIHKTGHVKSIHVEKICNFIKNPFNIQSKLFSTKL